MYVTVTFPGYRQAVSFIGAIAVIAAALRAGHTVIVAAPGEPLRWALDASNADVTVSALNPDLFSLDPAPPGWVESLAASAAPLL